MNVLNIKYNEKNDNNQLAIGKIFRIFNKNNGKSYINSTDNNMFTVYSIIKELDLGLFNNKEMQFDWNSNKLEFEAEDLQLYYTRSELSILIINWKKFFGGENYNLLYHTNNFNENEYKDIDAILEENKHYTYYISQLLKINHSLKEQVKVLNQNYLQLQSYDMQLKNNLSMINTTITEKINQSPIQILQMLTSLLTITSAECNKQFNTLSILNKNINDEKIEINLSDTKQIDNNIIQINNEEINNRIVKNNYPIKKKNNYAEKNNNLIEEDNNLKIYYDKINAAIQMIQQYIPNLKQAIKNIKNNQYINIHTKDKVYNELINIQQLFSRTTEQISICKNTVNELNNPLQFSNFINKITKQLQNLRNDFTTVKNNILNRIKQIEFQLSKKIDTKNLSTEELMKLKLQKSIDINIENNNSKKDNIKEENNNIKDSENNIEEEKNNNFKFFNGVQSIKDWLEEAYKWLVNNDYEQFAKELQYEVNKFMINHSPKKALTYLIEYIKGNDYDVLSKQFGVDKTIIIRNIDSLQTTHPAIYLACGYKSKTNAGKEKRVLASLKSRGITKIPF